MMTMKRTAAFALALMLALLPVFCFTAMADEADGYVLYNYEVFTSEETAELSDRLYAMSEEYDFDVMVCMVNSTGGLGVAKYADEAFDAYSHKRGSTGEDGVIFLVNTVERDWMISTGGDGEYLITDGLIEMIAKYVKPCLKQNDWYGASMTFADCCETILYGNAVGGFYGDEEKAEDIQYALLACETTNGQRFTQEYCYATEAQLSAYDTNFYNDPGQHGYDPNYGYSGDGAPERGSSTGSKLSISVIFGALVSFIMAGAKKSKNKSIARKQTAANYFAKNSLNIADQRDLYLYSNTTRVLRQTPTQNRTGGGGSYHRTSSGGHSHGGHGGKF